MPRYCAAFCCKNRRGRGGAERRLSFYPFPLHDKERLEKWLRNMKRDAWVPSKYQFLCSDHFTPDSLDVRWGIRYLKQTAIPTIFSLPEDSQGKDSSKSKVQKKQTVEGKEIGRPLKSEVVSASRESCSPRQGGSAQAPCSSVMRDPLQKSKLLDPKPESSQVDDVLTLKAFNQQIEEAKSVLEASVIQDVEIGSFHPVAENLLNSASALEPANPEHLCLSLEPINVVEETATDCPNLSVDVQAGCGNAVLFNTISQTFGELTPNEESVITILLPAESSKPSVVCSSLGPAQQEVLDLEDTDTDDSSYKDVDCGTEILQTEHSYCRQDINREQLWQKVSKLHSKITLLELQEQQTLGRLKSLEALIGQLKQENLLSEEKLKIVENCFTTFEVTMIQ
ncbi:THAP domain-containing protein 5 isoform X1 [Ornithorhynchus anatinus]|uniref:THAP domain-containing protein 5 n=2 Tax=Ornithorhynchus anatinus TaxID=9258 RepID=F7EY05_ORNAN|nr:THAP domain-containing protein 5 isoform X1 [Ornithorhynchus anatinus]